MSRIDTLALLIAVVFFGGVAGCSKSLDPDPGIVTIDCAPASITPTWALQGPGGLTVNGDGDSTMPSMAAGDYTLTWGDVNGWMTPVPNPVTKSLAGGGSITFSGIYTRGVVFNSANGHYYQLVEQDRSWTEARAAAASASYQGLPGHLATVSDAAENTFIYALEGNTDGAWLGGYQDRNAGDYAEPIGGWRWVTGEPFSYTHWASGEPNNRNSVEDYLGFGSSADWNDWDLNGSYVYSYVIEYEP